jgi:choline/ethanolamine kinase
MLTTCDLYNPKISSSIAQALAKFHALDMPFSKEPKWFYDTIFQNLKQIETSIQSDDENDNVKFDRFKSYNLKDEFKILTQVFIFYTVKSQKKKIVV